MFPRIDVFLFFGVDSWTRYFTMDFWFQCTKSPVPNLWPEKVAKFRPSNTCQAARIAILQSRILKWPLIKWMSENTPPNPRIIISYHFPHDAIDVLGYTRYTNLGIVTLICAIGILCDHLFFLIYPTTSIPNRVEKLLVVTGGQLL